MSKIVILLFAVLVTSAVDASGTNDQFNSLQNRLESYFVTEIKKLEEKYNTTKSLIRENYGLIYNTSENSIYANASDNVYAILSKAQEEARALINQMQNTRGIGNCLELAAYLSTMADDFLSYVFRCTDLMTNAADTLISNMETKYERLHSSLIDRRNRITACHHIVNNTEEVAKVISCIETIENETRSFIAESVPPVFAQIDGTNNFLSGLTSYLAMCLNRHDTFQTEAADLTSRAKMCYQKKIDNDKAAVSRSHAE